jgi:hypothetical protein
LDLVDTAGTLSYAMPLNPKFAGNMLPATQCNITPVQTFEMKERLLTLSLEKPRNAEKALKNYELFIYGDIHYASLFTETYITPIIYFVNTY